MSPTAGPARPYGGVSSDDRRTDRRARLVQAALDLTGEVGVVGLTVGSVCGRASVAKRYFYESFETLDDLLATALQEMFDQVGRAIEDADHGGEAADKELLTVAVEAVMDVMDDPRVARLYLESAGSSALLATRDRAIASFVEQLLRRVAGHPVDDPAAQMIGHLLVSGSTHVVAQWLRGDLALSRTEFVAQLVEVGSLAALRVRSLA